MQKIQYLWIFSKVRLSKVMKVMGPTVSYPDCLINFPFLNKPTWSWHIAPSLKTHGSLRVCYCQNSRPELFVGFLCLVKPDKFKPRILSFWFFWCLFLESKFIPKPISCTTLYALHVWLFSVDHPWRCDPCFDGPPSVRPANHAFEVRMKPNRHEIHGTWTTTANKTTLGRISSRWFQPFWKILYWRSIVKMGIFPK